MLEAFLGRDTNFDGVFVTGVHTTGIFCRPTCSAKKPLRKNLSFFGTSREALQSGYRPCLRCRPLEPSGTTPDWLRALRAEVETDPASGRTDKGLCAHRHSTPRGTGWFTKR